MNRYKWSSVLLILMLVVLPATAWAQGTATVRLVPAAASAEVGDTVNVDIEVDGAADLYGIEVHLAFDAARLQVQDDDPAADGIQILPGSLFPKSDPSYVAVNQADNTAGTVDFAITLLAPESPIDGSGTLATIRFAARMEGAADLSWTAVQLADSNGAPIAHTTAGGSIAISAPTPPPPPPPPPSGKACDELIDNGTMEANASWDMPITPHKARYSSADKHGGSRSIRLGVEPGDADTYSHSSAYQEIHVPANASDVTLSFWARRFTQETPKAGIDPTVDLYDPEAVIDGTFDWSAKGTRIQYDWQEVLILQADCYNWLATLMRARSNDGAWTQYTYDLSAYAGQDIVVYFNSINNGWGGQRTWMYVDDVQVQACYEADGACTELVQNRSFEWTGHWQHPPTPRPANYTTDAAYDGARAMRLGIVPPTADTYSHSSVYQAIDVPVGAIQPTLSFWYKGHSQEPAKDNWKAFNWNGYNPAEVIAGGKAAKCCGEVDWQEALILDANYQIVSGGVVMRQVRTDGQWRHVTYDLSPFRGQRIVLYFNVINDGNGQRTWMYVDDVSVNLCGFVVHFDPASSQVGVGTAFSLDVAAENVQSLYGVEATIRYDPTLLQVTDADGGAPGVQVYLGDWLPASTHVVVNQADNASGEIQFVATLVAPEPALSGSGNLIKIPFVAQAAGSAPVYLSEIKLVDANALVLPTTHADGQVTVTSDQATLQGKVLLEGRTDHSGTVVEIDGGPTTTTAADGSYTLDVAAGTYTLDMAHPAYLEHSASAAAQAGSTTTVPDVTLLGGDINGDQVVDILDLVAVGAQFGSPSPTPPEADVNGDGEVDIIDIVLVAKNF